MRRAARGWPLTLFAAICGCGRLSFDLHPDADATHATDATAATDASAELAGCPTSAGLVGYWPFDENGGTVANDYSASQQTGDLNGSVTWVPGHLGSAVQFDLNSSVDLRSAAGLEFGGGWGSITLSYWLAPSSLTVQPDIRPLEIGFCTGTSYVLGQVGADGTARFGGYDAIGNYADTSSQPGALQIGHWTHVAHVMDRTTKLGQTYIDGVPSGGPGDLSAWTDTIDCSTAVDLATFGGWNDFDYTGLIDDLRIYARALTPAEIDDLFRLSASGCPW